MKKRQFQHHVDSLPDNALSVSGGGPAPFDKEAGAFSGSWDWGIIIDPLGPGETAECRLMLGVDDNGTLTVDGEGIFIPGEGKYHGGTYREKSLSFPIEPGPHRVHMTYENVAVPPEWTNLAILNYSIEIMVSDGTSSSSYQPDEGYPEPVSTEDEGEDVPCECGGDGNGSQSNSGFPCPEEDNGEGDNGEDEAPCTCENNEGGSSSSSAHGVRGSSTLYGSSAAGRRVVARTLKTEMVWRTNFGSFRGMTGLPQGLLDIVGYTFSSELWTPRALHYWHPMTHEIISAPLSGIGANTAFQIRSGGTDINYYCYADGGGSGVDSVAPIAGSAKRGGSAWFGRRSASSAKAGEFCLSIRSTAGNTVNYTAGAASSLKYATGYTAKNGASYTREEFDGKLDIVRASDGSIRQIWNLWDGLANIENVTESGYRIALYLPEQVDGKNSSTGLYPVTGDPFKTFTITGDAAAGRLAVTEQTAGRAPFTTRYWQGTDGAWNMSQGEGEDSIFTLKEKQIVSPGTWKLITTIQRGENGIPISRVCETYAVTRNGNLYTSRIEGYGTDYARETTYEYTGMGKIAKETAPDGSVKTWAYDRFGREIVSSVPWAEAGDKVTYTTYRDQTQADPDILTQWVTLTATAAELWRTDYTYIEENHVRRVEKRTTALGEENVRLEVKESWLGTAPNVYARGRLKMKQDMGGIQTHYAYEETDQYGSLYKVTAETRIAGACVPGLSSRKVTYVSGQGNNMRYEQYVQLADGVWSMTDASSYEYDVENRWVKRTRANGRVYERMMTCCGPLWEKDENGVTTSYSYNTARQLTETIRSAIADVETMITPETITSYTRDALGKITSLRRDTGPMTTVESREYDLLGRLVKETDILGRSTVRSYSGDGLVETVTTPAGATLITRKSASGTILRRYGTGQQDILYTVEVTEEGIRTTEAVPGGEGDDPRVVTGSSTVNGFGDLVRVAAANTLNGENVRTLAYDNKGRLIREQLADMAPALYAYDAFGNRTRAIVALEDDPTILNSRITDYAYVTESREDGVYSLVSITSYTSSGTPVLQKRATLLSALSPVLAGKTVMTDSRGHDAVEWMEYGGGSVRLRKKTVPGVESVFLTRIVDGFTTAVTGFDGATVLRRRTYTETGITYADTDVRGNVFTSVCDIAGRIISGTDAAGNTTTYAYGQPFDLPTCVTNALGKTACSFYDIRGRKEAEWGTAVQPAVYAYDAAGHMVSLSTFRVPGDVITTDPRLRTDGDITTWTYDIATGLVIRKTYADATHVDTVYDMLNRVAATTDARGTVASRSYAPLTGELVSITFNDDGFTPSISSLYNHLGQLTQIDDASGTRMFTYNQYNEQETETTAGLAASVLTLRRDGVGRPAGYCLDYAGAPVLQTAWAYDAYGRLSSVSLNAVGKPFTYGYNEENGLLDTLDYPNTLKRWRTLEEKRDLPVKIDYLCPGSANYPAKTDYSYDILGRPVTKKDYFNAPAPDLTHTCAYNDRNELVSDAMSRGGTYSYSYDNIGNRKTSLEGTDSLPTTYVANRVNQYTDITESEEVPFVPNYDADGNQTKLRTATGAWEASYNALNQAVSFIQGDRRIECVYDYLNRRVEKSVYEGESLMSRKRFIYHGYLQIAELDATEVLESAVPVLRKTYLWDPLEPVATRILAMGVFDETGVYVEDLYYTHDALKNTTALFGIKAGRRALYEYGPYGSAVKMEGNAAELNPFRFSSEYADDELGLVYYNYRYYNPKDGRWLSRDILGEMHTQNNYAFMKNHAIFRFDLLGMYEYDEETKRQTKQFEKMINDCLSKFQGSGQYKAHPAALMPQEFYNDYPEEIPPNCLAHAIGCQKPIGTTYDQAVKELAQDCREVPEGNCLENEHVVMLYGFEPNEDDPDSYHAVRQDPNGNWSAAVGSLGIVSEIKDPQVHTNAFYNKCMQDLGGTPLIIDDKKTKRYCCCDRK
ncbi:RHS repeat-associated core domain-containing protein [Akkermansia sp.]|uniref:RHS repeat domain-containing protein n=1 Tax=Akkermansia sp. TaxID=1872421 RepID=UPI00258A5658|nr:RHS repeat-associated core domain-containing protein [Akkermansia sp.]MCC8092189.1 sugar-binding protein [Akkermansia sp.]